jgi:hypothetical protein
MKLVVEALLNCLSSCLRNEQILIDTSRYDQQRRCLNEPLSSLILSHFQLAYKSQRHPYPQASLPVGIPNPHMALLSNVPQRSKAPVISPLSFSLAYGWAHSRRHFFACSSKPLRLAHTTRPNDAAFFSLTSSHSRNHNRSVSAMRGNQGRRIGEGGQAR